MSRLPKAPLIEVIFEFKWDVKTQSNLSRFQYLHGDIYTELKNDYPIRESLASPEIPIDFFLNKPMFRYRKVENGYPLFQVGPGLVSLNTIDENYDWNNYFELAKKITNSFFKVYPYETENFVPTLSYFDFFRIDSENEKIIEFMKSNLHFDFTTSIIQTNKNPKHFSLNISYELEAGVFSVWINTGKNNKNEEGLIIQTKLDGINVNSNSTDTLKWLTNAHSFCSDFFIKMTEGNLYESFK